MVMVLCRKQWGSVAIAVEEMLEPFDAILKELIKCLLLFFMEVFKFFLVITRCIPDLIDKLCELCSIPVCSLVVCFYCLFRPFLCPFFNSIDEIVSQILLMNKSAVSLILGIFKERTHIILEMVVLNL